MVHQVLLAGTPNAGFEFLQRQETSASLEWTLLLGKQWPTWANALFFGLASSLTLPIGAMAGIYFAPVKESVVAGFLAFGAGALLFAVTVELYGEALHEVERDGYQHGALEICVLVGCAILGAWGYLMLNRWMDKVLSGGKPEESDQEKGNHKDEIKPFKAQDSTGRTSTTRSSAGDSTTRSGDNTKSLGMRQVLKLKAMAKRAKLLSRARLSKMAGRQKAFVVMIAQQGEEKKMKLAMAMWLGVLADGVPESILLGFLAAERRLSLVLVISLLIANFPESFSASSMLREAVPTFQSWKIVGMWSLLMGMTGVLACIACMLYPTGDVPYWIHLLSAVIEGLAGGAMLACIASVMLPEAYEMKGDIIGLFCVTGFLLAVLIKVFGGVASEITSGTWVDKHVKDPEKHVGGHAEHGIQDSHFFVKLLSLCSSVPAPTRAPLGIAISR